MANTVLIADAIAFFVAHQAKYTEQAAAAREECRAEEVGQILTEIAYHNKLRDKRMEWCEHWEKNGWRISEFYTWCQQQDLPS